jgi:hypothetical protein
MAGGKSPFGKRVLLSAALLGSVLCLSFAWVTDYKKQRAESSANYAIKYAELDGWKEIPHSPQAIFLYQHPQTKMLVRGAVNQVIADFNPTPGMNTREIARYYIERTQENMPDWTAENIGVVEGQTDFHLIRRESHDKVVITAFSVKGNTTLLVTLSGTKKHEKALDTFLPEFRQYLTTFTMSKASPEQLLASRAKKDLL